MCRARCSAYQDAAHAELTAHPPVGLPLQESLCLSSCHKHLFSFLCHTTAARQGAVVRNFWYFLGCFFFLAHTCILVIAQCGCCLSVATYTAWHCARVAYGCGMNARACPGWGWSKQRAVCCALYVVCFLWWCCAALLRYDSRCNQQMNNVITLCGFVLDFIARETPKSVLHVGHCTLNEGIV